MRWRRRRRDENEHRCRVKPRYLVIGYARLGVTYGVDVCATGGCEGSVWEDGEFGGWWWWGRLLMPRKSLWRGTVRYIH